MKTNALRRKISGAALTLAMMMGIAIAASATAQAQYRDYNGYEDNRVRWSQDRERQYAYALGYHNAYTEGRDAADRGNRMDYRSTKAYRNPGNGYRQWMGDDDTYRDYYRRGAEAGFKDGASRRTRRHDRQDVERLLGATMVDVYGESDDNDWRDRGRASDRWNDRWNDRRDDRNDRNNGRDNQFRRTALENGWRDGLRHGQEDRNRNRRSNFQDSSDYRDASRGYRSDYGNRDAYRNTYREGFRRGYEEGYRNSRSNNSRFPWPF